MENCGYFPEASIWMTAEKVLSFFWEYRPDTFASPLFKSAWAIDLFSSFPHGSKIFIVLEQGKITCPVLTVKVTLAFIDVPAALRTFPDHFPVTAKHMLSVFLHLMVGMYQIGNQFLNAC